MTTPPGRYWRMWLADQARLLGPFSSLAPDPRYSDPWPPRRPLEAWCDQDHQPPAPGCECGLRGMPGPRDVLASAAMAGWLDISTTFTVHPALAARIVIVIGRADLSGRMTGPSPNDPEPCVRGQYAQPCGPLYITGTARPGEAARLGRRYGLRVRPMTHLIRKIVRAGGAL